MSVVEAEIVSGPSFLAPIGSNLTTKQNLFVQYYLELRNGVKAAKAAGYSGNNNVLNQTAQDNLRNPTIRESIEKAYKSRLLSSDGVLAELSDLALAPTDDPHVKPGDKIRAAELIGKFHRLFVDKVETETSLSDGDVTRLSESIANAILEAAAQRRAKMLEKGPDSESV